MCHIWVTRTENRPCQCTQCLKCFLKCFCPRCRLRGLGNGWCARFRWRFQTLSYGLTESCHSSSRLQRNALFSPRFVFFSENLSDHTVRCGCACKLYEMLPIKRAVVEIISKNLPLPDTLPISTNSLPYQGIQWESQILVCLGRLSTCWNG